MIKRVTIGDLRLTFTAARIVKVGGFNSLLTDGNHILMWDFDDVPLEEVKAALRLVKKRYFLPQIPILETRKDSSYIAYCWHRLPWKKVIEIIAATPSVDMNFFKYGVYRDKFTLRVTDKGYGKPHCVYIIHSIFKETATLLDLATWVNYETLKHKKSLRLKETEDA